MNTWQAVMSVVIASGLGSLVVGFLITLLEHVLALAEATLPAAALIGFAVASTVAIGTWIVLQRPAVATATSESWNGWTNRGPATAISAVIMAPIAALVAMQTLDISNELVVIESEFAESVVSFSIAGFAFFLLVLAVMQVTKCWPAADNSVSRN